MKLVKISASNFKGSSFSETLSPLTVFIGNNFVRKTARIDAIRLALLGYLPELGKTPRATFGLSSGKEMKVWAEFDTGQTIYRRYFLKGDTVKVEEDIPTEIAACGQLAVMLNAEEYFGLSDRERVNYVFANVKLDEDWTAQRIWRRVVSAASNAGGINHKSEQLLRNIEPTGEQPSVQSYVADALEVMTSQAREARSYAERMEKTTQGLGGLRAQDAQHNSMARLNHDERRVSLPREIEDLTVAHANLKSTADRVAKDSHRRAKIERELETIELHKPDLESTKVRLANLERDLSMLGNPTDEELAEWIKVETKWTSAAEHTQEAIFAQGSVLRQARIDLIAINGMTECPFCGATGDQWKEKRRIEFRQVVLDALVYESQLTAKLQSEQQCAADAKEATEQQNQQRYAYGKLLQENQSLERQIAQVQSIFDREPSLREELARYLSESVKVDEAKLRAAADALSAAKLELKNLEYIQAQATARKQDLKRLAEAEGERDKAKVEHEVAKAAAAELRLIQAEMVQAAFDPLLKTANCFFARVLKTALAYNAGEIGTWRDGVWVAHHTFSGTEKLLTYAAIQAALASNSPVRIMLLDELGRIDGPNLNELLMEIRSSLRADLVDGCVGIDTGREEFYEATLSSDSACKIRKIG